MDTICTLIFLVFILYVICVGTSSYSNEKLTTTFCMFPTFICLSDIIAWLFLTLAFIRLYK